MEGAASSYSSVGNRRVLDTGSMTWSRKEAARSPGRSHDLRGSQDFEPARRSEPVRYNCVMDFRPVRVLLGTLPEIELAEPGQNAPAEGAIPMLQRGGPDDGGLLGYVSVVQNEDGSADLSVHGITPHSTPVKGCAGCEHKAGLILRHPRRIGGRRA